MKERVTAGQEKSAPKVVDWQEIRSRLETAHIALDQESVATTEQMKKILKQRARALAQEPQIPAAAQDTLEVVEFMLGYEKYGIELAYVREVYPLMELVPLPGTPQFVSGIVNVRSQVLSVIDLKKFFGLPEKGLTDLNKIIIIRDNRMEFGILADTIDGIHKVSTNDIQTAVPALTGIRADYIKGVTGESLIILDAQKLLRTEGLMVNEETS
jgi:purine-binding chemotaxis protein CheW